MTKRKQKPTSMTSLPMESERIGTKILVSCRICGGYGGVMYEDGDWRSCKNCGGGGKVYEEVLDVVVS